jgi:hypothetical protein
MHNNEHIREEEFEEALRRVKEELRKLEDRGFHDAVRRMAEENERLRNLQCKQYSQNSTSLSAGDRARCPKCNGTLNRKRPRQVVLQKLKGRSALRIDGDQLSIENEVALKRGERVDDLCEALV